jgi:hypothetical protein
MENLETGAGPFSRPWQEDEEWHETSLYHTGSSERIIADQQRSGGEKTITNRSLGNGPTSDLSHPQYQAQ